MDTNKLRVSLFLLRFSIFMVMLHWALEKFIRPENVSLYYERYLYISGLNAVMMYILGAVELIFVLCFLLGFLKSYTYSLILIINLIVTLTYFSIYFDPFIGRHLLFFASWPMLAGCVTLFLLRDEDTLYSL